VLPSTNPTSIPTKFPAIEPTILPSFRPTTSPSVSPTIQPSDFPTNYPTLNPTETSQPSVSQSPTIKPSNQPSNQPSIQPYEQLSIGFGQILTTNVTAFEFLSNPLNIEEFGNVVLNILSAYQPSYIDVYSVSDVVTSNVLSKLSLNSISAFASTQAPGLLINYTTYYNFDSTVDSAAYVSSISNTLSVSISTDLFTTLLHNTTSPVLKQTYANTDPIVTTTSTVINSPASNSNNSSDKPSKAVIISVSVLGSLGFIILVVSLYRYKIQEFFSKSTQSIDKSDKPVDKFSNIHDFEMSQSNPSNEDFRVNSGSRNMTGFGVETEMRDSSIRFINPMVAKSK